MPTIDHRTPPALFDPETMTGQGSAYVLAELHGDVVRSAKVVVSWDFGWAALYAGFPPLGGMAGGPPPRSRFELIEARSGVSAPDGPAKVAELLAAMAQLWIADGDEL